MINKRCQEERSIFQTRDTHWRSIIIRVTRRVSYVEQEQLTLPEFIGGF